MVTPVKSSRIYGSHDDLSLWWSPQVLGSGVWSLGLFGLKFKVTVLNDWDPWVCSVVKSRNFTSSVTVCSIPTTHLSTFTFVVREGPWFPRIKQMYLTRFRLIYRPLFRSIRPVYRTQEYPGVLPRVTGVTRVWFGTITSFGRVQSKERYYFFFLP